MTAPIETWCYVRKTGRLSARSREEEERGKTAGRSASVKRKKALGEGRSKADAEERGETVALLRNRHITSTHVGGPGLVILDQGRR